jgi:hypothetical protein
LKSDTTSPDEEYLFNLDSEKDEFSFFVEKFPRFSLG